jgi:hypothetical protein
MNDITQKPQPAIPMRPSKATTKPTSQAPIQNAVGTDKDGMFERSLTASQGANECTLGHTNVASVSLLFNGKSHLPDVPVVFDSHESNFASVTQSFDSYSHDIASVQPSFVDPQLYTPNGISYGFYNYAIAPVHSRSLSQDWDFVPSPGLSSQAECPSLTSGSTISSRNSSTRSTKSLRWLGSERIFEELEKEKVLDKQRCPVPECRRLFIDLKSHMVTHQNGRPEKCPIKTCEYHIKGFIKSYDRIRHINTHLKATMVCGFCPGTGSSAEKTFNRCDVFLRHLCAVHGAEKLALGRHRELCSRGRNKATRKSTAGGPLATCTLCAEPFDIQAFHEHLSGCVFRRVTSDFQDACEQELAHIPDTEDAKGSPRNDSVVTPEVHGERTESEYIPYTLVKKAKLIASIHTPLMVKHETASSAILTSDIIEGMPPTAGMLESDTRDMDMEQITASSRCLSLTSSNGIRSSDEETDWTEESPSPESDTEALRVRPVLSPMKRRLIDQIMKEFHHLFDEKLFGIRACHGGGSSGSSHGYTTSNASPSGDSSFMSRKRSLSGGGSRPPDGDRNGGDDHHKRRRPDSKASGKDPVSDLRFACPYYKRNPGRHQTFTSCRDPGFITIARLKEHLYRRHLLPIQCHRCCSTFVNEPMLREHQRDPQGCEIKEQAPLEGFDKEQERKLKSKKRSLVHLSEEEKWKSVYRILFPDDDDMGMPTPYIDYQSGNSSAPGTSSNIAYFQEFSRLELPRLVRRTLEVAVEQEAQPLEEKLKERLVDIVKECQTQLIAMFRGIGGTVDVSNAINLTPAPETSEHIFDPHANRPFRDFDSLHVSPTGPDLTQWPIADYEDVQTDPVPCEQNDVKKPSNGEGSSGTPDSGYESTWTAVSFPRDFATLETSFAGGDQYGDIFHDLDRHAVLDALSDPSVWSFDDSPFTGDEDLSHLEGGLQ